jgi:hypothetical protein
MVKLPPGGPEGDASVVATGVADVKAIAIAKMTVNRNMLNGVSK